MSICAGFYCGRAWDPPAMRDAFRTELSRNGLQDQVKVPDLLGGCFGLCLRGPNLIIEPDEIWYARVQLSDIPEIVAEHFCAGRVLDRLQDPLHSAWREKRGIYSAPAVAACTRRPNRTPDD